MRTIFAKYNSERLPKYQIVTKIVEDNDKKRYALKEPLCEEAKEHMENIYKNYELLRSTYDINLVKPTIVENGILFEMEEGRSLENILLDSIAQNDETSFQRYINKFLDFVNSMVSKKNVIFEPSQVFENIFGRLNINEEQDLIKVSNIDLIFSNIFVDEKDTFTFIDYEWVFDFEMPKNYLVWRGVHSFYLHNIQTQNSEKFKDIIEKIIIKNDFSKYEENFYNYVLGIERKYFLSEKVKKKIDYFSSKKELLEISDWATKINSNLEIKSNELEDKDKLLLEISDWATSLNKRLTNIDNNKVLRNLEKLFNKELSIKRLIFKTTKFVAKKILPDFVINKLKQRKNSKHMTIISISNEERDISNNNILLDNHEVLYVFPVIDWQFRIQRPQQIAKSFLNSGYKVVYFKTTFCKSSEPGYAYEILDNSVINVSLFLNENKNLYKDKLTDENINFLLKGISLLERDFLVNKRVSIVDHPFWFPLSKKLSGNFSIYDCMDYHPGFGDDSTYLVELEEMAMTQSDLLVLTSSDLYERFSSKNKNSILVRNGCEFQFFNKKPENIYKSKYEKVVGYYGAISSWFDTEMVISLAKYFPNYEFLLVGSTYGCEKLNELEKIKNVTLVGEVEYSRLTEYLYSFNVAIMPFKINELTIATNPVKVYEYLSSGVSVVSTKLPEIEFMGDVVYSAIAFDEFVTQISVALEKATEQILNKRIDFAKNNDWNERFNQIENKITEINQTKPKVSIILVTYNNLDFTKACLYSMERYNNYLNCEIIVVDNLSQDGTREYLTEYEKNHPNFKAILHDYNSGFAAGNNIGINEAKGEYVILLNNDTFITPNWIQNLIKHFELDNSIGMVGPRTNNIGNESRLDINYTNTEEMIEKSYDIYYENVDKQYNIPILAFFCVAIKREIIEKIGLLDEAYGIGMFEDDDYCMRAREQGHKLICADDVFIHHHLGASFDKNPEWKEQLFKKNKAIYESKWGKWEGHVYRKDKK